MPGENLETPRLKGAGGVALEELPVFREPEDSRRLAPQKPHGAEARFLGYGARPALWLPSP